MSKEERQKPNPMIDASVVEILIEYDHKNKDFDPLSFCQYLVAILLQIMNGHVGFVVA